MRRLLSAAVLILSILALASSPMTARAQSPQSGYNTYIVRHGDSLFEIAARFNVSISELATINRIYDVHRVYAGQLLILPPPLPFGYSPYIPYVPPAQPPVHQPPVYQPPVHNPYQPPAPVGYVYYVVQPGDTLIEIAERFGVVPQLILRANLITDGNYIFSGQRLVIPRGGQHAPTYPTTPRPRGNAYIVQPGDNLIHIGARFRRNPYDIARANGILNLNAIYSGQVLVIP
jgi:peptidoglycan-N-acetylglucosamine deacetylase